MSLPQDERALLLPGGGGTVWAWLDRPAPGTPARTPVLLCPPWGWAEVASYRPRAAWARRLAADGHPVLRLDLPATGDSAGGPRDPGLVAAWTAAVADAARRLHEGTGRRPAILGLGFGGLLACAAVGNGAPVDGLILWGVPADGRRLVRELRAFALLSGVPPEEPPGGTPGDVHAGGFLMTAATAAALAELRVTDAAAGRLRRLLLLEADGSALPDAVAAPFGARGVAVTRATGPGWASVCDHPEHSVLPAVVAGRVSAWLAAGPAAAATAAASPPVAAALAGTAAEHAPGPGVRERAVWLPGAGRGASGVLGLPADGPPADLCAVFLNAGAVRRVGPNRLWVEAARRFAAEGVPTLRVDLDGIGDADGGGADAWATDDFYAPAVARQVGAILDALAQAGVARSFLPVGLCAGAWAAFGAAADPRVTGAALLNPGALVYDSGLVARRELARLQRLRDPLFWRRAVRGELHGDRVATVARALVHRPRRTAPPADALSARIAPLRDGHARVAIAFSDGEPLETELAADGTLERLRSTPGVSLERLPGRDHTVRSPSAQAATLALLARHLDQVRRTAS